MAKKPIFDDDLDSDVDEFGGIKQSIYDTIIKKCYCGYRGELVPDIGGYSCPECGYLLVETK